MSNESSRRIEEMRLNYALTELHEKDIDSDPMVQFRRWFDQAEQGDLPDWMEVNAMTLSTSDGMGNVTSRIVLLKGIDDGKFHFYTNYDSTKGQQIAAEPRVSLCFFWPHLQRQIRIEGSAEKVSAEQSERYFHSRPRSSQLGARVSRQSSVVASEQELAHRMEELSKEFEGQEVPCPDNWGGYAVTPTRFEFWQGRPSRLHDRIVYKTSDQNWDIVRLSP